MRTSVWIAVICPSTGRVLIARRGRGTRNAGHWNFFGGGLDRGERPLQTARRELREEAGITVSPDRLLPLAELVLGGKRNLLFGLEVAAEFNPKLNKESDLWRWVGMADLMSHGLLHRPTHEFVPRVGDWLLSMAGQDRPAIEATPTLPLIPQPIASVEMPLSDWTASPRRPQRQNGPVMGRTLRQVIGRLFR